MNYRIRFNVPFIAGNELELAARCMASAETAGDGSFSKECQLLLEERLDAKRVLLTNSCTSALEIAALLLNVKSCLAHRIEPRLEFLKPGFADHQDDLVFSQPLHLRLTAGS